jgi:hypothetical protein
MEEVDRAAETRCRSMTVLARVSMKNPHQYAEGNEDEAREKQVEQLCRKLPLVARARHKIA